MSEKKARLFYYEEAENAWCPAHNLSLENVIDDNMLAADEEVKIRFKRVDMTDAEFDALPET